MIFFWKLVKIVLFFSYQIYCNNSQGYNNEVHNTLREENISARKKCEIKECEWETKFTQNCRIKEWEVAFLS